LLKNETAGWKSNERNGENNIGFRLASILEKTWLTVRTKLDLNCILWTISLNVSFL
jgi:hypothetical protein